MKHFLAVLAGWSLLSAASAQDAYVIGLSGALTGANADTYAPGVEGLTLYVDQLNKRGGVHGKPIRLIIHDNQGEPSKAAADAKKLITQDNVILLVNFGLSSSYGPMAAEAKRGRVAQLFSGGVCPTETYPPTPDEFQFCSVGPATRWDSEWALRFIKEQAKEPVKLGLAAMAIPVSRGGVDYAEQIAPGMGFKLGDKQVIPPTAPDYTPFATKLKSSDINWVFSTAPWVTEARTFEALRKLGWNGKMIVSALNPTEDDLPRIKDDGFYTIGANAMFVDNAPAHNEIREAAKGAKLTYPVTQLSEGWVAGMVIEQALKAVPWPPTREKVQAAMDNLKVDTKGLRGGPLEWNKTNHFRTKQYYRVYHWDSKKNAITKAQDWITVEVK